MPALRWPQKNGMTRTDSQTAALHLFPAIRKVMVPSKELVICLTHRSTA